MATKLDVRTLRWVVRYLRRAHRSTPIGFRTQFSEGMAAGEQWHADYLLGEIRRLASKPKRPARKGRK